MEWVDMSMACQHDWMPVDGERAERSSGEEGFLLIGVVVMVAILLIFLAVAAPVVARQLQRDKEVESQHRMEQYVRAIQLYQQKFSGQYPPSIKALENTNNVRFLRHVYVDPLTGKADYRLIHQGEQKTKIHVFFGEELEGIGANLGSAAGMQSGGAPGTVTSGTTNVTSTNALNAGFGNATIGTTSGTTGGTSTPGSTASSGSDALGDGTIGSIVGVGTSKTGTSITQPNGQTTYETWEYWYDPRIELLKRNVNVTGGGMTSGSATSVGGLNAAPGTSNSFGSGLNGTTGSAGTNGTNGTNGTSAPTSNPNSSTPNPF